MPKSSRIKRVLMVAPRSTGGNFEYVAIPRQGPLFLSGALEQYKGDYIYDREIWYEDRSGRIDPDKDLEGVDILMITALINEAPRAYEIARSAKACHPNIQMIGGGPHMSPLAEEALSVAGFDVIVQREGEDIIGPLCDAVLKYQGSDLSGALAKIPGISYLEDGGFVQTERRGVISPDFVELPDFASVRDVTPQNPLAAGVMETVRGCTEKCTYCQVIQQFLGYRMIRRETELKRLAQLTKMAEDGLIYTARDGRFSVFISDDLHPPPLRAVKYRDERVERLKGWKGHSDAMWMICQTRAEIGQDPKLAQAMWDAGIKMLYVGVESSNAKNLEFVKKRQDINQVNADLVTIKQIGFTVAAMTIIGLPYDTEEGIMEMADWVKTVSRYQTANLLTPLPSTINWSLTPLDEDGSILPEGKMRPYHLYTGRQFVHHDERWTMQESRDLFDRYTARLHPVDKLYSRIFTLLKRSHGKANGVESSEQLRLRGRFGSTAAKADRLQASLSMTINHWETSVALMLKDMESLGNASLTDLKKLIAQKTRDLQEVVSECLGEVSELLSSATGEIRSNASPKINELAQVICTNTSELTEVIGERVGDVGETISARVTELQTSLCNAIDAFTQSIDNTPKPAKTSG